MKSKDQNDLGIPKWFRYLLIVIAVLAFLMIIRKPITRSDKFPFFRQP